MLSIQLYINCQFHEQAIFFNIYRLQVSKHSAMLVVDLYLDEETGISVVDDAVVRAAYNVADSLLKVST